MAEEGAWISALARWIEEYISLTPPPEVMERAKLAILDALACAVAAVDQEPAASTLSMIADQGGASHCTVIGTGMRTSVANAVLANGVLIRALDYNDLMGGNTVGGHPGDNVAAVLTVGEWRGSTGREIVSAVVLAYELYARLQALIDRKAPWDHTTASGLVVPAVSGVLMKMNRTVLSNAIAISAAHAVTLAAIRSGNVSSSKAIANALVAQLGVIAALLAERGLTGPLGIFEAARGAARAVSAEALAEVIAPHNGRFRIMDAVVKAYPCIGTCQSAVAAALQIRSSLGSALPAIDRIEVRMADTQQIRAQLAEEVRRHPASREAADHSFYFLIAVALTDGELTTRQFQGERWLDPDIREMMKRINISADGTLNARAPGGFPCALEVSLESGETRFAECIYPPGHPQGGDVSDVVRTKFLACARERLTPAAVKAVVDGIMTLETLPTLGGTLGHLSSLER